MGQSERLPHVSYAEWVSTFRGVSTAMIHDVDTAVGDEVQAVLLMSHSLLMVLDGRVADLCQSVPRGHATMILLVDLGRCHDIAEVRRQLRGVGDETGLGIVLQHYDIFVVTSGVGIR